MSSPSSVAAEGREAWNLRPGTWASQERGGGRGDFHAFDSSSVSSRRQEHFAGQTVRCQMPCRKQGTPDPTQHSSVLPAPTTVPWPQAIPTKMGHFRDALPKPEIALFPEASRKLLHPPGGLLSFREPADNIVTLPLRWPHWLGFDDLASRARRWPRGGVSVCRCFGYGLVIFRRAGVSALSTRLRASCHLLY
jgi:hypothetical protein